MQKYNYTTVEAVLAKHHRDLRGIDVNESDAIEWIGEALEFMKIPNVQEEAIAFSEVKNFQCDIPKGLHNIIQIALDNKSTKINTKEILDDLLDNNICEDENKNTEEPVDKKNEPYVVTDCDGNIIGDYEKTYYRPYFDLKYEYSGWFNSNIFKERYTPIRLANHTFFNTLVCKGEDGRDFSPYKNCSNFEKEYTIVQDQLRFSFKEGIIAIAYYRQKIDYNTGYPMIPDDISCVSAINYYMTWKLFQRMCYLGRANSCQIAEREEIRWLKYVKQFKNKTYMPFGADQHQNMIESNHQMIPKLNKYYGFFGNLGKKENKIFNNPDRRNIRYNWYGR